MPKKKKIVKKQVNKQENEETTDFNNRATIETLQIELNDLKKNSGPKHAQNESNVT